MVGTQAADPGACFNLGNADARLGRSQEGSRNFPEDSHDGRRRNAGPVRKDKRFSITELAALATRAEKAQWNELDGQLEAAQDEVKRLREASRLVPRGDAAATLEDVWVHIALRDEAAAQQLIDRTTATRNPFDVKYSRVEDADWETCSTVLNKVSLRELMSAAWKTR